MGGGGGGGCGWGVVGGGSGVVVVGWVVVVVGTPSLTVVDRRGLPAIKLIDTSVDLREAYKVRVDVGLDCRGVDGVAVCRGYIGVM